MILDTNALSAYLDRAPEAVEIVSEAREIAIPVIVAGEFAFGIARSRRRELYERSLQALQIRLSLAPFTFGGFLTTGPFAPSFGHLGQATGRSKAGPHGSRD